MTVRVEKAEEIWTVILDRQEVRNAVDRDHGEALLEAFEAFEADQSAKVAVLWGAGGHFCAGADLKAVAQGRPNRLEVDGAGPMGPSRLFLSKPVIAAVSGYAVAGGLELAIWCDLRVAEEDARFGVFCRRWGVPLIDGGTVRLPRLIGMGRALDMILTGREITAGEALNWGLCDRVVPRGESRARAEELARRIAGFPQICLRSDRRSVYEQWGQQEEEALRQEFLLGQEALQREGVVGAGRFEAGGGRHGRFEDP